ncbi:MAG: hypothetical protein ACHQIG_08640 [Acidimicrobiia bacterium]
MSTIEPDGAGGGGGATGTAGADERLLDWRAMLLGALLGLAVLVAASVVGALLDRNMANYDKSGWRAVLFVVVLVGYLSAGFVAGRRVPSGSLSNGALAATLAFVLWIPIRIVIWAVRDENKALFTGSSPVFKPGQIFGHLVIASALGMLGGVLGARLVVKRAQ